MHRKIRGKLRYRALPMLKMESGMVFHTTEKEIKLSLILSLGSQNSEYQIRYFFLNLRPKESSIAGRVEQLATI